MPSDVQVFVRFKEQAVFAGEELNAIITIKNIADPIEASPLPSTPGISVSSVRHAKRNSISQFAAANTRIDAEKVQGQNALSPSISREERPRGRHQNSFSLSMPNTPFMRESSPAEDLATSTSGQRHQRSLSIISMSSSATVNPSTMLPHQRPVKHLGHRRSSTVQFAGQPNNRHSRQTPASIDTNFGALQLQRQPSTDLLSQPRMGRRNPLSASHSPSPADRDATSSFVFPATEPKASTVHVPKRLAPSSYPGINRSQSYHKRNASLASRASTHRTSMDMYNGSDHSDETLQSEQVPPSVVSERPLQSRKRMPSDMIRQHYNMGPAAPRKPQATTLLMGYASVNASFVLDASLVDQTPFEEVKKRGFMGGQSGGGVVGVNKKKARPASGLFSSFNFASIGESLDSILGTDTSSSAKEMKAITNSRAIPLLSTPQSLLFVNVHLEPGEERHYSFSYRLPHGLPASHRGKAIKTHYNLTIGVQYAADSAQSAATGGVTDIRQIQVPFRVFSGVDSDGEILGHDLMQPHVVLKDTTKTAALDHPDQAIPSTQPSAKDIEASNAKFLEFTATLLNRHQRRLSSSSITVENPGSNPTNTSSQPSNATTKTISAALSRANQHTSTTSTATAPNKFSISSSSLPLAQITISRPLFLLGEQIILSIDLSKSPHTIASVRCTLETHEKVDAGLAVRSAATIARITRRIYACKAESALFTNRLVFTPTIPGGAVATFITTGVSLEWFVRVEFSTVKHDANAQPVVEDESDDSSTEGGASKPRVRTGRGVKMMDLLEEVIRDDRGVLEVAVEKLDCDSFEVMIPITVYGCLVDDGTTGRDEVVGVSI